MIVTHVSDARDQYRRNMLNATAAPRGSVHRFRYAKRWLEDGLWDVWGPQVTGQGVLLVYLRGNASADLAGASAVPIRYGRVHSALRLGDYAVLDIALTGFCDRSQLDASAWSPLEQLLGPKASNFVHFAGDDLGVGESTSDSFDMDVEGWQSTVAELGLLPEFCGTSFAFVGDVRERQRRGAIRPIDGQFPIRRGSIVDMEMVAYQARADAAPGFTISTDPTVVRNLHRPVIHTGYRFTATRLSLQALHGADAPETVVTVTPEDAADLQPKVDITLRLKPNWRKVAGRFMLPALSAAIAAGAGLLPEEAPTILKIAMLCVGSAGVAAATSRSN